MALNKVLDDLMDIYFKQSLILYDHLFSSYHQFIEEIIPYCLQQESNIFYENIDGYNIYFHGFKCSNIRIKPAIFDNDNNIIYPKESRKNNINYFSQQRKINQIWFIIQSSKLFFNSNL